MSAALGLITFLLVFSACALEPEALTRARLLRVQDETVRRRSTPGPMTALGRWVWVRLARFEPWRSASVSNTSFAALGAMTMFTLPLVFFSPMLAAGWLASGLAYPLLRHRSHVAARHRQIQRELPLVVDMFRLAIASGLNVSLATKAIATRLEGALPHEFSIALREVDNGKRIADALEAVVARTSEDVRPLVVALTGAERYGAPLSVVLERLALECRVNRERHAERAAKRLGVQLLFPVAGCTLPAFALLTVAPLLAGGFGSLAL